MAGSRARRRGGTASRPSPGLIQRTGTCRMVKATGWCASDPLQYESNLSEQRAMLNESHRIPSSPIEHSRRCSACVSIENHFKKTAPHGEVYPTPRAFETRTTKRACVGGKLTRVLKRIICPFRTWTGRRLVVDDNPPDLGLKEHVDPAMEDLTIVLNEFYGMLDQRPVGGEAVVQNRPEAPCAPDRILGRDGSFTGCTANETCSTIDRVVTVRIHKLGGDDRVQGSANPSHVIAVDGNSWSHLDNVANNRALHGLSLGRGNAFAEGCLGRHS